MSGNWHPILAIYPLWCIFWAYANHRAIDKANEHILHAVNGLFHLAFCLYFGIAIYWALGACLCFLGRTVFDVALNLFRGLPVGYVPKLPKSIFDKAEIKVFGKYSSLTPKAIYLLLAVVFAIIALRRHS